MGRLRTIGFLIACAGFGCGPAHMAPPDAGVDGTDSGTVQTQEFIAAQSDFEGFLSWTSYDGGEPESDGLSTLGDRIVYINELPPHGSTEFPVGTIIVKTINWADAGMGPAFAMVKRGGDFNDGGAVNWEWMEITPSNGNEAPLIVWRGTAPPPNQPYFNTTVTCNSCHAQFSANDYVPSQQLLLSSF